MIFMTEMHLDPAKLMRFVHMQGLPLSSDGDFGYAAHAWLTAAFGGLAPKPFRLFERRSGLRLLGYSRHDGEEMHRHAQTYAEPIASEVCSWNTLAAKPMPEVWGTGRRLGFELRACPITRRERERDVFLAALERAKARGETPPSRETVYMKWLFQTMKAATEPGGDFVEQTGKPCEPTLEILPNRLSIIGFRRVKVLRRGKGTGAGAKKAIERPEVIFSGELVIRRPEKFSELLSRGVGRHRAFGFGMLLLRPSGEKNC